MSRAGKRGGYGRFLDFTRLDLAIGQRHGADDFSVKLIRHAKDRPDNVLVLAPRGRDVVDRFVPAREAIAQHAFDHGQRNEQKQNERAHAGELQNCAMAAREGWLGLGKRRRRFGHRARLLKRMRFGNKISALQDLTKK